MCLFANEFLTRANLMKLTFSEYTRRCEWKPGRSDAAENVAMDSAGWHVALV